MHNFIMFRTFKCHLQTVKCIHSNSVDLKIYITSCKFQINVYRVLVAYSCVTHNALGYSTCVKHYTLS